MVAGPIEILLLCIHLASPSIHGSMDGYGADRAILRQLVAEEGPCPCKP